jgi:hypothetical protein
MPGNEAGAMPGREYAAINFIADAVRNLLDPQFIE